MLYMVNIYPDKFDKLTGYVLLVYVMKIVRKTMALFLQFGGVHTTGNISFSFVP